MTALWREIHLLEERVEVLENALETSRDQIARTEEKYDKLQKLGNFPFSANPRFLCMLKTCCCFFVVVEELLKKQLDQPPLDADKPAGTFGSKIFLKKRENIDFLNDAKCCSRKRVQGENAPLFRADSQPAVPSKSRTR